MTHPLAFRHIEAIRAVLLAGSATGAADRLALAGSDKTRIQFAHVMVSDMRHFVGMDEVWHAWVDQASPPARACGAADLGSPDMKVEIIVTAAVR